MHIYCENDVDKKNIHLMIMMLMIMTMMMIVLMSCSNKIYVTI